MLLRFSGVNLSATFFPFSLREKLYYAIGNASGEKRRNRIADLFRYLDFGPAKME
jgi:hypothetical protein